MIMISNNPMTADLLDKQGKFQRIPVTGTAETVLTEARKYLHQKWQLLADPGAGRDKQRRNPYLTLWLWGPGKDLDLKGLAQLESQLLQEQRSPPQEFPSGWENDFQLLDAELATVVRSALGEGRDNID